jgi:hypothetical protein
VVGPGNTALTEPQPNVDADPQFVDALAGNYHLADSSPAIDAAYSPALAADELAVDLDGQPRIQDGNGDGISARDMGALEHSTVPVGTTQTSNGCGATRTRPRQTRRCARYETVARFSARGSQGANRFGFPNRLPARATRPGSYRATVTASAGGNVTKPVSVTYRIRG